MCLFTDAYDFFCIPPIMKFNGRIYYGSHRDPNKLYQVPQAVTPAMIVSPFRDRYRSASFRPIRFLLGVGIGGDYPLSATIMSEFANKKTRGAFIAGVFSMHGFGILASSTVTMIVCSIFNRVCGGISETPHGADLAWRIILMIGAVPAGLTYYWRMMMPENAR
ncbi:hypothetical protein RND71_027283 [Anisodus tanguticus]|uniref:Major facilitator superfamily (MFS) profile domain-containing protein n=1 Tax=Anisodus tanguticus TaxID=243964 RepID=A0AAE1RHM5_9SOLA|nr:hypothetical protein RND71_027283 [Anisodus tanguticus]